MTIRNGIERIGSIQGVAVASATCCMPLENDTRLRFVIVGRAEVEPLTELVRRPHRTTTSISRS